MTIEIVSPFKTNKILFDKIRINKKNKPFGFDHLCFYSKNIKLDLKKWEKNIIQKQLYKKHTQQCLKNVAFLVLKLACL